MGATDLISDSAAQPSDRELDARPATGSLVRANLALLPAFLATALMVLWAAHDGGYDQDTWYWGALVLLAMLAVMLVLRPGALARLNRPLKIALIAFALYVTWSYLSITWASSKGDALTGSNRALLYLIVFALFAVTPWTPRSSLLLMLAYVLSIGVIGGLILLSMARGHHSLSLFSEGRLVSPTGYFNASAALFTSMAFVAITLAVRRELPAVLRGVLAAIACAGVQLALLGESRGWLFTLPFMLVIAIAVAPSRLRTVVAAILPTIGALAALSPLLDVFRAADGLHPSNAAIVSAAKHAGRTSLLICAVVLVLGALLAALDGRVRDPRLSPRRIRLLGTVAAIAGLAAAIAGGVVATHGHPFPFIKRQWNGFTHPEGSSSSSHFAVVGSGRYDAWRVSLDALKAHPLGGLGQDNYADYYLVHRRTGEELQWTHSFEFRLLAHTGLMGFLLFAVFGVAAWIAALRNRRRPGMLGAVTGIALLPFVVWLVHGSVDWFWEMPALSGPALGFLAMAASLREPEPEREPDTARRRALPRALAAALGVLALAAAVFALGFPYLSVRKVSEAFDIRASNPTAALSDLSDAASLNPLSAIPGRMGGAIALQSGQFTQALRRFNQAISREPGGWFSWLGAGLAASALGDNALARHDLRMAASLNSRQPAVTEALKRVDTSNPLSPSEAFGMLQFAR
jgi:tetratricopeptide (TPR) repeat protein